LGEREFSQRTAEGSFPQALAGTIRAPAAIARKSMLFPERKAFDRPQQLLDSKIPYQVV